LRARFTLQSPLTSRAALSEVCKTRSTRRSTPRHPIDMASTAKSPDPMPCALSAILLPESRARARLTYAENLVSGAGLAYMRRCAFLGRACTRGAIMRRASTAGAGATTWVRGVGAWRRGCGRRPLEGSYSRPCARAGTVFGWACRGLGDAVRSGSAGLSVRGRLG